MNGRGEADSFIFALFHFELLKDAQLPWLVLNKVHLLQRFI
jgi:hypothetical protein